MTGAELLRLLMEAEGVNPNSLADKLRNRSLQSQLQRFLSNQTKNPRTDTLRPVAKYFGVGVDVFLDDKTAKRVAIERGLLQDETSAAPENAPSAPTSSPISIRPTSPSLRDSLRCIAKTLAEHDESARRAVAVLLSDVAIHPESVELTADRIEALLGVKGNDNQHRFSASS